MADNARIAVVVLALSLVTATVGCNRPSVYDGPVRHVIFVSLDTTRADHFGFYGNQVVQTPQLDRLAAESIVFDDFMTVVPTTLASHTSLFSGKYPQSHGTPRNGFMVNDENVMLAEILRERGFATAGFVASFPLEQRFGIAQGFEHYDQEFDSLVYETPVVQDERSAAAVTDAVIEYLDGREADANQFLFVHYFDPHAPYAAPAPYDTLYDPQGREGLPSWEELTQLCRAGGPAEAFRRVEAQYAGEISYMDEQLGRLLDALRERGILDEALLVITSDHGEVFTEHPGTTCYDHGWMTFQQDVRAVGLVRLPEGKSGGTRIKDVVASVDILPSVLSYLGLSTPDGVEGEPVDLAQPGQKAGGRVRFSQATKPWQSVERDPRWKNLLKARCVRSGRYKMVQVPFSRFQALFDLEADPLEQTNLLENPTAEIQQVAERLRAELEAWAESADPLPSEFVTSQRDEVLERLRILGYAGEP